jgi:hypothetical protein
MEEKYIELLTRTNYESLSSDEKVLLKELCTNQSEFEQAKQLMNELSTFDLDSDPGLFDAQKVKKRLDEEFVSVYTSKGGGGWINFLFPPLKPILNRPGMQLAIVLVLFLGSYLVLELMDFNNTQSVQLAKNENKLSNEDEENAIDSEINKASKSTQKNIDNYGIEDSESNTKSLLLTEVEDPFEPKETVLMMDRESSSESTVDGTRNEGFRPLDVEELRSDFTSAAAAVKNNGTETSEFLIPTVQESPDLLDGLFVTF